MKYISEINSFYDWLETNTLADSDIVLWHALMHICNKAGWPRHFAVAVSVLQSKTGLKKDRIFDARKRLGEYGRIKWESRKGNQSALYELIPFCVDISDTNSHTVTHTTTHSIPTQSPTQIPTQKPTINRLDKTRPKEDDNNARNEQAEVISLYENNIGFVSGIAVEKLGCLIDEYPVNWVKAAITEAVTHGARNLAYIETILKNWKQNGFGIRPQKAKNVPSYGLSLEQKIKQRAKSDCLKCNGTGKIKYFEEITQQTIEVVCDCCKVNE